MVVGYLKEAISAKFGDSYQGKKLIYIEQENIIGGTMDALLQAKDHLTEKFLILMGDDIYSKEDINAVVAHDWALLVQPVPDTVIRVTLYFELLDEVKKVETPTIIPVTRNGFTAVEWGGIVKTDPLRPFSCFM